MPNAPMKEQAEILGFTFSRKGCPCNGTPLVYVRKSDETTYTLTLWTKRNVWRLTNKGCTIATGNAENLTDKISNIINK